MSRFLRFCMRACCCRNDADDTLKDLGDDNEEEDNEIFVYRVYRSSSVTNVQNADDIMRNHPCVPKTSKSEVFDFNEGRNTRKTRGNRSRQPRNVPEQENGVKEDIGGDTGDVTFNDDETLYVLDSF